MTVIEWRSAPPWVKEAVTNTTRTRLPLTSALGIADGGEPASADADRSRHRGIDCRDERTADNHPRKRAARGEIEVDNAPGDRRGNSREQNQQPERAPVLQLPDRNPGAQRKAP